jgi:glycosyltransferase involved in cell wall biosynthesis
MKILVYPHNLQIGGSQIVAINLAGAMQGRGHEVLVCGPPGPLAELASSRGLRIIEQPRAIGQGASLRSALLLRRVLRQERVDLVHASAHSACLEAFLAAYLLEGIPLVGSVRGTMAPRPFPKSVPLIVAHDSVGRVARRLGHKEVHPIWHPIDTEANHPGFDGSSFREMHGLNGDRLNAVLVSRLAKSVKGEGLRRAIDAIELVARDVRVRLVIVGGGEAEPELRERAEAVNRRLGDRVVLLTGQMLDPRPAYAAADVVLGMQGSLLRGMAFEKPAIVLGEKGFSEIVTPETTDRFLTHGFFGLGDGDLSPRVLSEQLRTVLVDPSIRERLGRFSRQVVCANVSLGPAAERLERIYEATIRKPPSRARRWSEGLRFAARAAGDKLMTEERRRRSGDAPLTASP